MCVLQDTYRVVLEERPGVRVLASAVDDPIQTTRHAATSPRLAYIQCGQNNSDFSDDILTL